MRKTFSWEGMYQVLGACPDGVLIWDDANGRWLFDDSHSSTTTYDTLDQAEAALARAVANAKVAEPDIDRVTLVQLECGYTMVKIPVERVTTADATKL